MNMTSTYAKNHIIENKRDKFPYSSLVYNFVVQTGS